MTADTSTSITVSWQLPPADSRNGIIAGFKLFYKKKGSFGSAATEVISDSETFKKTVTRLLKYTEYEFQVLVFTSTGDGPKSHVQLKRTKADGKQMRFSTVVLYPVNSFQSSVNVVIHCSLN